VSERLDLGNYLPYLLNRVGFALVESFTADALKAHGLTIDMWRVLAALSSNGGQRQVDLSGLTSIDVSTMSRLVSRLVRMGLVTRSRSQTSNREVVVALSAKGRTLVQKLIPIALALEKKASAGLSAKELAEVKRLLTRMYGNLSGEKHFARLRRRANLPAMNVQAQRNPGPPVWLDMDQQALDDAYDQEIYAPNRALVVARRHAASDRARARIGNPKRVSYGPTEIEALDIFDCGVRNAPINIFVHGGAWRRNKAADYALNAEPLVRAGAHSVILDFINVDEAGGDLFPMYDQVRRGIAWVARNAESFGGDPTRIYLSAHSSGSHLAGCFLTRGWREESLPPDVIKGAVLLSGMYDLKPVRLSKRSSYVKFTDRMEELLSAQRHIDGLNAPLILAIGTEETPEFQRQSRDFAAAVAAAGKPVELIVGEAYNHFELLETLANPYGLTGRAMFAQMKLLAKFE
jgi:arylformamidase